MERKKKKKVMFLYVVSALFLVGLSPFSEWAKLLSSHLCHLLFLSPTWCHNFSSHHQHVALFSHLYFPSFCSLIGWMFSAWHHHCLREHCSPGLRSRCPYVYKYDHLSTAAVNISLAAAFKESNWFRCLILFHLFPVWFINKASYKSWHC